MMRFGKPDRGHCSCRRARRRLSFRIRANAADFNRVWSNVTEICDWWKADITTIDPKKRVAADTSTRETGFSYRLTVRSRMF